MAKILDKWILKASLLIGLICFVFTITGEARPTKTIPDQIYYSNTFSMNDQVADIGDQKNLEEVFKNYYYYVITYNKSSRVKTFKCFERGLESWSEVYHYKGDVLVKKVVTRRGKSPQTVVLNRKLSNSMKKKH